MKKRIIVVLSVVLSLLAFSLTACHADLGKNEKLSELRSDILKGSDDEYSVVLVTGIRENPFEIDGVSQKDKVYFTVITVAPVNYDPLAEYNFTVLISGQNYTGKLSRHPFNQTYSAEINALTQDARLTLVISRGETDAEIELLSVKSENFIDAQKAFEIAEKKLKNQISNMGENYEIFVRLIENPINEDGGYFWYVAFVGTDNTILAVLINPVTMEIAAERG